MATPPKQVEAPPVAKKVKQFKKTRLITLPHLKLETDVEHFLKFISPFVLGKMNANAAPDKETGKVRKPPMIAQVIDLNTGEMCTIIGGASLLSELQDAYPGETYVQKSFSITPGKKKTAKNGNNFVPYIIAEIEEA